jgi:hypothetical protein
MRCDTVAYSPRQRSRQVDCFCYRLIDPLTAVLAHYSDTPSSNLRTMRKDHNIALVSTVGQRVGHEFYHLKAHATFSCVRRLSNLVRLVKLFLVPSAQLPKVGVVAEQRCKARREEDSGAGPGAQRWFFRCCHLSTKRYSAVGACARAPSRVPLRACH